MPDTAVDRTVTRDVVTSRPPSGDVTRTVTGLTPGLRVWTRRRIWLVPGSTTASVRRSPPGNSRRDVPSSSRVTLTGWRSRFRTVKGMTPSFEVSVTDCFGGLWIAAIRRLIVASMVAR